MICPGTRCLVQTSTLDNCSIHTGPAGAAGKSTSPCTTYRRTLGTRQLSALVGASGVGGEGWELGLSTEMEAHEHSVPPHSVTYTAWVLLCGYPGLYLWPSYHGHKCTSVMTGSAGGMSCMGWVSWLVEDRPSRDGVPFAHREEICASRSSFLVCSLCDTCATWNISEICPMAKVSQGREQGNG